MEENLPPGFRFHPTDEELITYYLTRKVSDTSFTSKAIAVVDLNKNEPWDLPGKASMGEKEWYFFSLRDRKYPTGLRTNRATESGYWKTTGKDKEIMRSGGVLVGMKKTLVFYKGRAPKGEKSNWVMHEYRLQNNHSFTPSKEEWVVCRVFQKSSATKKTQQTSSSQPSIDSPNCDTNNSLVNEFGDVDLPNLNTSINNPNSSIAFSTIYNNDHTTNMNWPATTDLLPWSSALLNPNLSVNSLLLKALHLRNCQQREAAALTTDHFASYMQQPQGVPQVMGTDNLRLAASSSSKVLECTPQQQQQEQPFNLDSIW